MAPSSSSEADQAGRYHAFKDDNDQGGVGGGDTSDDLSVVTITVGGGGPSGSSLSEVGAEEDENCCRICGDDAQPELLIEPCDCSGSVRRVHSTCLQRWIAMRPIHIDDGERNDSRMRCEICHADYRIAVSYTFSFSLRKCCHWVSIGHLLEMLVLIFLLSICSAIWPMLSAELTEDEEPAFGSAEADKILIPTVSIIMIVLTLVTLYKVFQRWKRANSSICIDPSFDPTR